MARIREMGENWPFIYMGENEMKFNLSLSVVEKEKKKVLNLVSAGKNWFEIKNTRCLMSKRLFPMNNLCRYSSCHPPSA